MSGEQGWFVLEGQEPRGPFERAELERRVATGALAPTTMVALPGWAEWKPASEVFPSRAPVSVPGSTPGALGAAPQLHPSSSAAPSSSAPASPAQPAVALAIDLRCVEGPDAGKAFWIGASEVSLGTNAGLSDPVFANANLRLIWVQGELRIRVAGGATLVLQGVAATDAKLVQGQRFGFGASTWQVGREPVQIGDLLANLGQRLSRLASVEQLEGFSLREMFSEVFTKRTPEEIDDYFLVGTAKTTPPIDRVQTGWPKPWLFFRVLLFLGGVYAAFFIAVQQFNNPRLVPGLIMMGSLAMPLATVILFFELNTPRNVSFRHVLTLLLLGGVGSLFVSLIGFNVTDLSWLGASSAGIVEETGKLLTVILIARGARFKYILNGLLFGAAVGAGFAAFESAGYAFWDALMQTGSIDDTTHLILIRAFLSPFGHVAWTAIAAGALWRVKGDRPFAPGMLLDASFLKTFLIPVALHMIWNSPLPSPLWVKHLLLGFVSWFVVFGLVQQGLRQVKKEQIESTRQQLESTQTLSGIRIAQPGTAPAGA